MTLPIIMHTTFLAAKHGIFTHGLESYTPTKTDTIYNWRSVRSFVTYGAPPYNSAALDLLKVFLIFAHTYLLESTNFSWPLMESWAEESH